MDAANDSGSSEDQRYRAPALEKGLDILELISRADEPLTVSMIASGLGRSSSELFRMIQVLEHRGYIAPADTGNGYVPTTRLFSLAMRQPPVRSVVEVALPIMRRLAEDSDQSCHLALRAEGDIVIAARMESAGLIGFSVRIGYRQPLPLSGSGAILFAFQSAATQARWAAMFDRTLPATKLSTFRKRVAAVHAAGHGVHPSEAVPGIVDLSAPILRGAVAAAALTMPFVEKAGLKVDQAAALDLVVAAADDISQQLASSDIRT